MRNYKKFKKEKPMKYKPSEFDIVTKQAQDLYLQNEYKGAKVVTQNNILNMS